MQPDEWSGIDPLLSPRETSTNGALREKLFLQTSSHLRRRARVRMLGRIVGVIAAFAGGMLLMSFLREPIPVGQIVVVQSVEVKPPGEEMPVRQLTPAQVELEAEQALAKQDSIRLFREAGDRFLREEQNLEAALRCYRNFLDDATASDLALADSDTWLLTSLKNARRKEIIDE